MYYRHRHTYMYMYMYMLHVMYSFQVVFGISVALDGLTRSLILYENHLTDCIFGSLIGDSAHCSTMLWIVRDNCVVW